MTPLEEEYFTELTRDRTENANTLDKPSMQGAKDNAVEKYSDQAHFQREFKTFMGITPKQYIKLIKNF